MGQRLFVSSKKVAIHSIFLYNTSMLLRKIISNTAWQLIARIASSGTSFCITILIARSLGVSGYGDLAKITAFVSLFYLLIDLGLNAVFLQSEEHEKRFADLFSFRIVMAIGLFFLVGSIALFLPYTPSTGVGYSPLVKIGIIFFGLTFLGRAVSYSTAAVFQREFSYRYSTLASLGGSVMTLISVALFLFLKAPLLSIVGAYVLGSVTEGVLDMIFVKEKVTTLSFDTRFAKRLLLDTLPITIMLLLNLMYFRVDLFLLTILKSTHDVAMYDFAYRFFDFLIALPLFLSNSMYPALLSTEKNTRIALPKLMLYTLGFAILGVVIAIPVWIGSPLLLLVKHEFSDASLALRLLVLSLPIFFATNIIQWVYIAKKKQVFLLFVYGGSLLLNIILNIFFIPHYSYVGSAIITGVSEAGVLLALLLYSVFVRI